MTRAPPLVWVSPDGKKVITGSVDHTARVWDTQSGAQLLCISEELVGMEHVAFSPDGKTILTGGTLSLKLRDATSGKSLKDFENRSHVLCLAYSPDGRKILSGSEDGVLRVYEVP